VFTVYNLNPARRGQVRAVDVNSTDAARRSRVYNGIELGATGRLRGASFFGGWTFDRLVEVQCDSVDNPNYYIGATPVAYLGWCDRSALDLPFRHEFKLAGSYTLPFDIQVNAAFQSYAGPSRGTTWLIAPTTRYAADCIGPCTPGALVIPNLVTAPGTSTSMTLLLTPPGSDYYDRLNQLDLGFRKLFRFGRFQYSGQVDLFNFTNNDYVKSETRTFGPALGRPLSTLQPRTLRLAVQMRF
jgi:hypothetical protein